eukprot:2225644-Rhodomonas_salina.3
MSALENAHCDRRVMVEVAYLVGVPPLLCSIPALANLWVHDSPCSTQTQPNQSTDSVRRFRVNVLRHNAASLNAVSSVPCQCVAHHHTACDATPPHLPPSSISWMRPLPPPTVSMSGSPCSQPPDTSALPAYMAALSAQMDSDLRRCGPRQVAIPLLLLLAQELAFSHKHTVLLGAGSCAPPSLVFLAGFQQLIEIDRLQPLRLLLLHTSPFSALSNDVSRCVYVEGPAWSIERQGMRARGTAAHAKTLVQNAANPCMHTATLSSKAR